MPGGDHLLLPATSEIERFRSQLICRRAVRAKTRADRRLSDPVASPQLWRLPRLIDQSYFASWPIIDEINT